MFHASYDHRHTSTRRASAPVSICCGTIILLLGAASVSAQAGEEIETEILEAYSTGLARSDDAGGLSIHRFGNTHLLIGTDAAGNPISELACLLCTEHELISNARSLGALAAAESNGKQLSVLEVGKRDPKEQIYVDGIPLLPLKGTHPIEPGEHEITEVYEGGIRHSTLTVAPEERISLAASHPDPSDASRMTRVRAAAVTCGLGLATATLGGLFLWIDRECATSDCSVKHYLQGPGIALLVTGALVQGIVIWLLISHRKNRKGRSI